MDKTSFLREDKENWPEDKVKEMTLAVKEATDAMWLDITNKKDVEKTGGKNESHNQCKHHDDDR